MTAYINRISIQGSSCGVSVMLCRLALVVVAMVWIVVVTWANVSVLAGFNAASATRSAAGVKTLSLVHTTAPIETEIFGMISYSRSPGCCGPAIGGTG